MIENYSKNSTDKLCRTQQEINGKHCGNSSRDDIKVMCTKKETVALPDLHSLLVKQNITQIFSLPQSPFLYFSPSKTTRSSD